MASSCDDSSNDFGYSYSYSPTLPSDSELGTGSLQDSSKSNIGHSYSPTLPSDSELATESLEDLSKSNQDVQARNKLPLVWVPTFKQRVDKLIGRLLNEMKFCTSGKMITPPIIVISIPKLSKYTSFPLYDETLRSILPAFKQPSNGNGTEKIVDIDFRNFWELRHFDFQILNFEWNLYLMEVLVPIIQNDLSIEVGFRLSLCKMMLYTNGSFFKPHCNIEIEDGMFGTVVIQLPSLYDGGKLIVRHNGRTEEIDYSTTADQQNTFSMFYTAFYRDCEHEFLPIKAGVWTCLVYNMVTTCELGDRPLPSARHRDREGKEAELSNLLRNDWSNDQKIVYCLSEKYSQKNLSFENLKTTDRIIAEFFKNNARSCSLEVVLGNLRRKKYRNATVRYKHCDEYDTDVADELVREGDPNVSFYYSYKIKHVQSLNELNFGTLPSMNVDFDIEVVPESCFHDVKSFYEDQHETSNEGLDCFKLYQCATIMVFRRDNLVPILVKGDAKSSKVEEFFLREFQMYKDYLANENIKEKFLKWSLAIMDKRIHISRTFGEKDMRNSSEIFECFLLLDNIEVLQKYLQAQKFDVHSFSYVYRICRKYGWAAFSNDIAVKFSKLKPDQRMDYLEKFIEYQNESENDRNKESTIHIILKEFIQKFENELDHPHRKPWRNYRPRPLKKEQREEKTKQFLTSLWPLANKVHFVYLVEYTKSISMNIIVPVLITLGERENIWDDLWIDVAKHFKAKMEEYLERPAADAMLTWKQNISLSCHCKHCQSIEKFLRCSYKQIFDFYGKAHRRDHVKQSLKELHNVTHWTTRAGVLRIKKPKKTGQIEAEERDFIAASLPKIRSLITAADRISNVYI